jgi:hypothetical protein
MPEVSVARLKKLFIVGKTFLSAPRRMKLWIGPHMPDRQDLVLDPCGTIRQRE